MITRFRDANFPSRGGGRAITAGAISLAAPEDKPYQERGAGVKDKFGNTWWISKYKGETQ